MDAITLRFYTGGSEPWEFYKKINNGKITYHHFLTNNKVSAKYLPEDFLPKIVLWDNVIDTANTYKDLVEKHNKLITEIKSLEISLDEKNI
jgi:hypothetical protein